MLTHPTLDQLRALKLDGMAQAFVELEAQEDVRNLAHAEWLALLLDREAPDRNTRRFQTRLRAASTTPVCRACSPISISPMATAASRGCSACW
jgi:DNA replication protein DnaC